jgi:hypothetical protein
MIVRRSGVRQTFAAAINPCGAISSNQSLLFFSHVASCMPLLKGEKGTIPMSASLETSGGGIDV